MAMFFDGITKSFPGPPTAAACQSVTTRTRTYQESMMQWPCSLTESLGAFQAIQLQQCADQLQLELERTKKKLSLTKQELESDRVHGDNADVVSETDIITGMDSLNDCIYRVASAVADAHVDNAIQLSEHQPSDNTRLFFGESLCNFIADAKQHSTHPRILVSLQACMNHFCSLVLSSKFDSIVSPEKTQVSNAIKVSRK